MPEPFDALDAGVIAIAEIFRAVAAELAAAAAADQARVAAGLAPMHPPVWDV